MIALPNCQEAVVPWICGPNFVTFSGHQVEHFLFLQGLIESRKDSLWKSQVVTVGLGFPSGSDSKESTCNLGDSGSIPGLGRSPGGGHGNPLQCSCLENPHGQMSLVGYSPWGRKESDRTEQLTHVQQLAYMADSIEGGLPLGKSGQDPLVSLTFWAVGSPPPRPPTRSNSLTMTIFPEIISI